MNSNSAPPRIAYFSMEIALEPSIPTYSGGLGVLAGDTLRSAADLGVPVIAVTLLHRKGYFRQRLDGKGNQREESVVWKPEKVLEPTKSLISLNLEGRLVKVRAWRYLIRGISGHAVPVYLLDTRVPENSPWDQSLTDCLYGGDQRYRLCQEVVLGLGGVEILRSAGYAEIEKYHMNEGHSALLVLALLERRLRKADLSDATEADMEAVKRQCIFTTHTPVPAGHDQFSRDLTRQVLGEEYARIIDVSKSSPDETLNMTSLALRFSSYINGVAMQHGFVSQGMFPRYPIHAITNGVHAVTWTSQPFRDLYDRYIPAWRTDNLYLRYAVGIPLAEIQKAHAQAKQKLVEEVGKSTGVALQESILTIGFARRAASYKRADLLFINPERLRQLTRELGPLQVVYAGKAHPQDEPGKELIRRVYQAAKSLKGSMKVAYVEDYDMRWGQIITSGVDLWLNTPKKPYEASGTSGMKAALNGVPSLSVLDGWWIEGHVEGATGWAIGANGDGGGNSLETASMYDKLELVIMPAFYGKPEAYAAVMRSAIALNGSFFNTQRMVSQYVSNAYFPEEDDSRLRAGPSGCGTLVANEA
jgi:glycogen phosphorylase